MDHSHVVRFRLIEAGLYLEQAAWISGDDGLSLAELDGLNFAALEACGHFGFCQIVTASAATAHIGLVHFDEVWAGDSLEQFAWLRANLLSVGKVACILVGHATELIG